MWSDLKQRLVLTKPKGHVAIKVTRKDFQTFERRLGFALPESYVAFMKQIGPGQLRGYFNIAPPLGGARIRGIDTRMKQARGNTLLAQIYNDLAFVDRMVPFADTIGGDICVWDPHKKVRASCVEYSVFILPRDRKQIVFLSKSFRSFITKAVFGHDFEDVVLGCRDPEWRLEYGFRPLTRRTSTSGAS